MIFFSVFEGLALNILILPLVGPAIGSLLPLIGLGFASYAIPLLINYLIQESYRKDVDGYLAVAQLKLEDPSLISKELLNYKEGTSIEMTTP